MRKKILIAVGIIIFCCTVAIGQQNEILKFRCYSNSTYYLDNLHSFTFRSEWQDTSFICTLDLTKNKFTDYHFYPYAIFDIVSKPTHYLNKFLKIDFMKFAMVNSAGKNCNLRIGYTIDDNGKDSKPIYIFIDYDFLGFQYLGNFEKD